MGNSIEITEKSSSTVELIRQQNYVAFDIIEKNSKDKNEDLIDDYLKFIYSTQYIDALLFWKLHDQKFQILSTLAKKYLGVPASSASVERMFSISGHILSSKRASMSVRLFALLVFLKLNENFL